MRSPPLSAPLVAGMLVAILLCLTHTAEIRGRAEAALGAGMPEREAELARGFVLGEDERIDPLTAEDFRRSGLGHLLAVSGQNVALLVLLAMPALAALGIPFRPRLGWALCLIVAYVPLAGAGPSILRAGTMGALSVLATLAGRRTSRLYVLALAAIATLAVEPGFGRDVGWQLSFAAVLGILLLAPLLRGAIGGRPERRGWRGALADGAAMTLAATLATAPLVAFHFEAVPTATLAANLLAMPAVAPAMWLGMLAAAGGQVPGFPVELVNAVNAPLLAYVAQVAAWCGRPSWALLPVRIGWPGLVGSYLGLAAAAFLIPRWRRRRRIAALRRNRGADGPKTQPCLDLSARRRGVVAGLGLAALVLAWQGTGGGAADLPPVGLRVTVLDVGQGDAILLRPAGAAPVLLDTGPPGAGLAAELREAGAERLGAAVVTHDQSDHAGGLEELLGSTRVERLLFGALGRERLAAARAAGVPARRIYAGGELRSGRLRLSVLWPPRELLEGGGEAGDPNRLSLVLLARWRGFSMLLTGDAEAAEIPLDPGPVDVLKVAHHGSEDAGLDDLLARTGARAAVISVGAGNPFGHPAAATLSTLEAHRVRTWRTDRDGDVSLGVGRASFRLEGDD